MPIEVQIPTPLRAQTEGQDTVTAAGATVQAVLADVIGQFPALKDRLFDEAGQPRRFINLFVNDEDIRFLDGLETAVQEGDSLAIIPAVAGG
ncbi:MAG TPA: MoaD/ThiS family protein [Gemmatales bacterium]|nr:MoaD/ThiS family protein [Gemmatales bacterium]